MKKIAIISFVLLFISSCKKTVSDPEPSNQTPTVVTGQIAGKTTQYSQSGQVLSDNLDKVTVSLDNDPSTTSTDAAGNYTLSGVKQGVYTIFFSKPGCVTYQIQQVIFPGNGTLLKNGVLIDSPTFSFSSASISVADSSSNNYQTSLNITVNISPQATQVMGTIYFGSSDQVSSNSYSYYSNFSIPANTSTFTFNKIVPLQPVVGKLFAKIYPYSGYSYSYFDNASNSAVNLGLGTPLPVIKIL